MIVLYLGLFLFIIGNGFFKLNILILVGDLYLEGDKRKDVVFIIFYMGINLGLFFVLFICGILVENVMVIR